MKSKALFLLRWATALCALLFVFAITLLAAALHLLRPGPAEWAAPVRLGPWHGELSGPAMLRIATHPLVLKWLDGRRLETPLGPVTAHAGKLPDRWRGVCAPCAFSVDALGREALRFDRVEFTWRRDVRMDLLGDFMLTHDVAPQAPVRGQWRVRNGVQQVEATLSFRDVALAQAFGWFAGVIPEVARARIDGRLTLDLGWQWPSRAVTVKPRVEGFAVEGLGT